MPKTSEKKRGRARRAVRKLPAGKTDWARLEAMTDEEIEHSAASDPDAAPILDEEWLEGAQVVMPQPKSPVYIRLDRDVLAFFKKRGAKYQTRINAVLKAYVEIHTKRREMRKK